VRTVLGAEMTLEAVWAFVFGFTAGVAWMLTVAYAIGRHREP
jgi:poly(A) polymerase Pap1